MWGPKVVDAGLVHMQPKGREHRPIPKQADIRRAQGERCCSTFGPRLNQAAPAGSVELNRGREMPRSRQNGPG